MRRSPLPSSKLAALRALFLCAVGLAAVTASATDIPEKGWEYDRLDSDHVVIHSSDQSRQASAINPDTAGDITVPATLRSMQVVSIGEKAFYNCSKLTSVTIPEGVTNIADNAFSGCTSLTNVVFPASLKSIGSYGFYNCGKLGAANFKGASLAIGTHAFRDCTSLSTLNFSGDLVSLGECAFSGCTGLRDVVLTAKSVTAGAFAFSIKNDGSRLLSGSACTGLTNIVVDASDVSFGESSFAGCTGLRQVSISAKTATIGTWAFSRNSYSGSSCTSLSNLVISATTVTLGGSSFSECTALSYVKVASSSLVFGESAFASCTALGNVVTYGASSAVIGASAFSSCSSLRRITLPVALKTVQTNAFYKCTSLQDITFPSNVTHIAYRAFDTCTALKSVGISEGLAGIDSQAFYGCSAIKNLALPQSLETIGARAFEQCGGLTAVSFSEGNTNRAAAAAVTIGERAFYQCSSLKAVKLPQTLVSMGPRAFSQCGSLVSVNLPTNFTDIAVSAFEDCTSLATIYLPDALESVGNTAFFGCTSLTGFLIPTNNVVEIGSKAFNNTKFWNDQADGLVVNNGYILGFKGNPTSVALPDGCKSIPVGMFEGMTALVSVTVPDSVTEIGARAFAGSGITNIAFKGVTTMGNATFEGCASLAGVSLSSVLSSIPGNAFKDCLALTSVAIPDAVASVGEYAFYNCRQLSVVTGAAGVTKVGDYAFAECPALLPFEFPNDVAYGDHVFQGCTWTEHVLFPSVGTLKDEYPATYDKIRSIVFSSNMSTITNGACAGCACLEYVRIPDGVTTIGGRAFDGCSSMTSVVMSASVANVGTNSFAGCSKIVSAVVSGASPMSTVFPEAYAKMLTIGLAPGIQSLCDNLFSGCASLAAVDIPWTVTKIGARAFYCCSNLTDRLVVPEQVDEIGALAFGNCVGLRSVNYLCEMPSSVVSNIYTGTRGDLLSMVLPVRLSWQTAENIAGATVLPSEWQSRRIVWWSSADVARVRFSYSDGQGSATNLYYLANAGRSVVELPEEPEREGYTFVGWFTDPYGGEEIEEGVAVGDSVTYYAHWEKDGEEEGEVSYDFTSANVYNGYLLDADRVVGSVQVKFAKGRVDASTGETNATATATVQLLGENKVTARGTLRGDLTAELAVSRSDRTMELEVSSESASMLTGSFDGFDVVALRDVFSSSRYADKVHATAMLNAVSGKHVAVMAADGDTGFTRGYAALSVAVGAKGKVKVSGTMPDGARVSATAQLAVLPAEDVNDDVGYIPVVAQMYSKKGGFGLLLTFERNESGAWEATLSCLSDWIADKQGTTVPLSAVGAQKAVGLTDGVYAFASDISSLEIEGVEIASDLAPDDTEIAVVGKKWVLPKADRVKFLSDEGAYEVVTDNGNPAALKLTYTASTGLFKGSFKLYGITEAGRSKKYTATVNGGVVGGVGYGSAVIKKVGSVPVAVE